MAKQNLLQIYIFFKKSPLHNKIFISADFEPKQFGRFFRFSAKSWPKFFGSKSAEMKILLCKMDTGNKLYELNFFELCSKKIELMKQNHLLKLGFVIFLKGAPFSDFFDYSLLNYMPSGIQICIPLFWEIFFQLGSSLIKQWWDYQLRAAIPFF